MKHTFILGKNFQVIWVVSHFPRPIVLCNVYNDIRSQYDSVHVAAPLVTVTIHHEPLTSVLGAAALGAAF